MSFSRNNRIADSDRSVVITSELDHAQNTRLMLACFLTLIAGVCLTIISNNSGNAKAVVSASVVGIFCLSVTLYEVARSAENIRRFVRNVWIVAICGLLPIIVTELFW